MKSGRPEAKDTLYFFNQKANEKDLYIQTSQKKFHASVAQKVVIRPKRNGMRRAVICEREDGYPSVGGSNLLRKSSRWR